MPFTLAALPYAQDALEPVISAKTLSYHYGKHHKGYVDKLNERVAETRYAAMKLEEIVVKTAGSADKSDIFNNAAQVWNHDFYWNSLSPKGGGEPPGDLGRKIEKQFGSYEEFLDEFAKAGIGCFGSGWAWLVESRGVLKITKTANAENPLSEKQGKTLLALDVWEHAYYLDYQNKRDDYLKTVLNKLLNWDFARMNLSETTKRRSVHVEI